MARLSSLSLPALGIAAASILGIGLMVAWPKLDVLVGPVKPFTLPYLDAAAVARGGTVYEEHCAACHGDNLEGQPNWRQRLETGRLPAPPHDASGHTWHHPSEQLVTITAKGPAAIVGGSYESDMPAFEDVLTEDDIIAVLAFIKSTWPEEVQFRHNLIDGVEQ